MNMIMHGIGLHSQKQKKKWTDTGYSSVDQGFSWTSDFTPSTLLLKVSNYYSCPSPDTLLHC